MKKFMIADLIKQLENEADRAQREEVAWSLGVEPGDVDDDDVENYLEMGRENKGSLESSIGPIQWIYDNKLKAYLILAYLTFEIDKDPKPVMYKLSPQMMKEWNNSESFGEYWNQNIRKNAQIEDDEWACGCNPNPCEPQKIDQFTNKFNSIS